MHLPVGPLLRLIVLVRDLPILLGILLRIALSHKGKKCK